MRRFGIFIGAALAVIASIFIVALSRFDVNHYRTQIQTEMEQRLGRRVVLGNLKLKLIPLRLHVENLTVSEDPKFAGRTPFLRADAVDLSMRLLPLLRHKVEIDAVEMKRPSAQLIKDAKGVWNFSSIGQGVPQTSPGSATEVVMEGNVILHDSLVSVTDLGRRESRRLYDHIDMTLRDFAPGKPFSIDATARISSQGGQKIGLKAKVGPLSDVAADRTPIDGTIDLQRVALNGLRNFINAPILARVDGVASGETKIKTENGKLTAVGSVKLEKVRVNGLDTGYPVTAQYNLVGDPVADVVTIVSSVVSLGNTPVSVTGSVNGQPTPAELNLKVTSKAVPVGEVARLAGALGVGFGAAATMAGQLDCDVAIKGPADNPTLNGHVSTRNVRIAREDLPQAVEISSVDLAITPNEIRSNNFEVRSGNTTAVANFGVAQYTSKSPTIDFAFRTQNANFPEVLAIARAYGANGLAGINGSGTLNLDIHASGPVQSVRSTQIMNLVKGTANLNLNNVRLAGLDVEHELSSMGGFKKSVRDRGGTNIERLTGRFVVTNGVAQTNDLHAVLNVGNVGAAGTANLNSHTLNLRATAVLSKAASKEAGGSSLAGALKPVLENRNGELVIPGMITGTFEQPKFEPDMQQLDAMRLKGILPTSDNPFGVLGTLFGHDNQNGAKTPASNPFQGPEKFLGRILGGGNKK
jgi:uncharacterized protein involved in outer membrane biogenesis